MILRGNWSPERRSEWRKVTQQAGNRALSGTLHLGLPAFLERPLSVSVTSSLPLCHCRACTWPPHANSDAWSRQGTPSCVPTWRRHFRAAQWSGPSGPRAPSWLRTTPTWMKARESVSHGWWLTGREAGREGDRAETRLGPVGALGLYCEQMEPGSRGLRQQAGRRYKRQQNCLVTKQPHKLLFSTK